MIHLGSIHGQTLIELVQLYGAAAVRDAVAQIIIEGKVTDPSSNRHSSSARTRRLEQP